MTKINVPWTDETVVLLQQRIKQGVKVPAIAKELGRTVPSVRGMIQRCDMSKDTDVSCIPREDNAHKIDRSVDVVKQFQDIGLSVDEIATLSGRSVLDVRKILFRAGISIGPRGAEKLWTEDRLNVLRELYGKPGMSASIIAAKLNCTATAVHIQASKLKLCGYTSYEKTIDGFKTCNFCKVSKPVDQYNKVRAHNGRMREHPCCKECQRVYSQRSQFGAVTGPSVLCMVCGASDTCVDHDHATGKVRGALCRDCNLALGCFTDSVERMRRAVMYLSRQWTGHFVPKEKTPALHKGCSGRRERDIVQVFGIMPEQWRKMVSERGSTCDICGEAKKITGTRAESGEILHVDHCHTTQEVRGLLCPKCNVGLGRAKDSIPRLEGLIKYIENPPGLPTSK